MENVETTKSFHRVEWLRINELNDFGGKVATRELPTLLRWSS